MQEWQKHETKRKRPSLSWAFMGLVRGVVMQQHSTTPCQIPGDDRDYMGGRSMASNLVTLN